MEKEDFGDKGKWRSSVRDWKITKDLHNTMVINFKQKTIRCAPNAWFRLETVDKIFVFWLGDSHKMSEDPLTKGEKDLIVCIGD